MDEELDDLYGQLKALPAAVAEAAKKDPALRAALRGVASSLLAWLDHADRDAAAASTPPPPTAAPAPAPAVTPPAPAPGQKPFPIPAPPMRGPRVVTQLTLGNATIPLVARGTGGAADEAHHEQDEADDAAAPAGGGEYGHGGPFEPLDPPLLARRFDLKARACRWVVERRRRLDAGESAVDLAGPSRELYDQAKDAGRCFLWMMAPGVQPPPDDLLADLGGVYECAARGLEAYLLATEAERSDRAEKSNGRMEEAIEQSLFLLAEAQSALRIGLGHAGSRFQDFDQRGLFEFLRRQASTRGVYIPRYMTLGDPADPHAWPDLLQRVGQLRSTIDRRKGDDAKRQSLLGKARYHARRAAEAWPDPAAEANGSAADGGSASTDALLEDWRKLADAVEHLVAGGLPPSDVRLREILLPLFDDLPDAAVEDAGAGVRAVLDEIERYQAQVARQHAEDEEAGHAAGRRYSGTVAAARERLRGRTVVLLGGFPRAPQARKLEEVLELSELRWISTLHHQSLDDTLWPQMQRPEVSVVMVLTKWRSHAFGPQARQWCKQFGKAFVELPAGYGVEQVAHQIMSQASDELAAAAPAGG